MLGEAAIGPSVVGPNDVISETPATLESREARFERILRKYGDAMARICAAYERDPGERSDLWQDMAFAIWTALPGFRGACSEKTFVYRVARNRALTQRFRRKLATTTLSEATDHADPRSGADEAVERASERARLLRAVPELPETLRGVVVLRLEGLNDREIADVLGVSPNNVAVRLTRARDALRRRMQRDDSRGDR
jgi:RNA polymerase sigma factor (sigma-70 family)